MMTSSTRFRNSGRKWRFSSAMTLSSMVMTRARGIFSFHEIFLDDGRAEVARHDDDGVLEIHRAALSVRQASVVEHLQQYVEDVRMRLLDFVEEHHGIRASPHGLAQLPAFVVADVTGRRADEPLHGVLFHVFAHVNPHHRVFVIEQKFREGAGGFRFADAGGAEENERTDGPVRVLQAAAGAAHGIGHGLDGGFLADDALRQAFLHFYQLLPFAFQHPRNGDMRPRGHDLGDVLVRDFLAQQRGAASCRLSAGEAAFSIVASFFSRSGIFPY